MITFFIVIFAGCVLHETAPGDGINILFRVFGLFFQFIGTALLIRDFIKH